MFSPFFTGDSDTSFPGSAWERTAARLCLAVGRRKTFLSERRKARQSLAAVRSQAEPGNEVDFFVPAYSVILATTSEYPSENRMRILFLFCSLLIFVEPAQSQDKPAKTVEQIAEQAKPSVVVILSTARDGKRQGLGTGFVVGDGLIATNYHVIGEARPIQVQFADGSVQEVTSIHSSDRNLDLAVIRVRSRI